MKSIIVKNMNAKKSCRSDSPKIQFIKLSIDIISPIIAKIFNICFLQGVFPNSFKLAEVIPVYKSGNRTDPNNYRPISLLSPFSKIFESLIYNQLIKFLNKNNIIYKHQYGFRTNHSTEKAVNHTVA